MPRLPRCLLPTPALYLVTSRGVERRRIVLDHIDRAWWRRTLYEAARRFDWILHAWILLDNHFHLVLETVQPDLSDGMQLLNGLHAQRFNRRYDRVGHLFQGRFDSRVIDSDEYLAAACHYVYENATRVGLHDWSWRGLAAGSAQTLQESERLLIPGNPMGRACSTEPIAVGQVPVVGVGQRLRVRESRLPAEQPLRLLD